MRHPTLLLCTLRKSITTLPPQALLVFGGVPHLEALGYGLVATCPLPAAVAARVVAPAPTLTGCGQEHIWGRGQSQQLLSPVRRAMQSGLQENPMGALAIHSYALNPRVIKTQIQETSGMCVPTPAALWATRTCPVRWHAFFPHPPAQSV